MIKKLTILVSYDGTEVARDYMLDTENPTSHEELGQRVSDMLHTLSNVSEHGF